MPFSGWYPPKRRARWLSILVSVKREQGGGLVPLTGGENQTPTGECTLINICTSINKSYKDKDTPPIEEL